MLAKASVVGLLVACLFATVAQAATDYCGAEICNGQSGIHTACVNPLLSWSTNCVSPNQLLSQVSDADKVAIVDAHNELRRKVAKGLETLGNGGGQPAAANMRKLVWNQEIADVAQTLAQTCVYAHDKCRNLPGMYVGQNLALTGSSVPVTSVNWQKAVNMWYGEVKDMTQGIVNKFGSETTAAPVGHYTQVVWAETTQVGCGVSLYKGGSWYRVYYVCNYGPGGNWMGSPVYQVGTAASACPAGTQPEDGLCA